MIDWARMDARPAGRDRVLPNGRVQFVSGGSRPGAILAEPLAEGLFARATHASPGAMNLALPRAVLPGGEDYEHRLSDFPAAAT